MKLRPGPILLLLTLTKASLVASFSPPLPTRADPSVQALTHKLSTHIHYQRRSNQQRGPTMIVDKIALLQTANIVLASGSPRRQEILNTILKLGVNVIPSTFEENLDKSQFTPETYVKENARQKALEVWRRLEAKGEKPDLVIGSDTIVAHGGMILEKPRDETHAFDMLKDLSGTSHEVFSGVALLCPPQGSQGGEPEECCFVEMTKVNFAPLEDATIRAYVASGEPMDKAGGYGIQEVGGSFVKGIEGDYFNVMGFPMHAFSVQLSALIKKGCVVRE